MRLVAAFTFAIMAAWRLAFFERHVEASRRFLDKRFGADSSNAEIARQHEWIVLLLLASLSVWFAFVEPA